jgi:DNA gyrase inhibitor GyrI
MAVSNGQYTILESEIRYEDIFMSWESMKGTWMPESELKGKKEVVVFGGALRDIRQERRGPA